MPIYRLHPVHNIFPHPLLADEHGVLAVFGDLTKERLLTAYSYGIFPWYSETEPVMWWFPDPRCVLYPDDFKLSKSMRSVIRNKGFEVRWNTSFNAVLEACSTVPRPGQEGTWLNDNMKYAYTELYRLGYAHSVETWLDGELVGGLYGVSLGKVFFGESMFSKISNASKVAFASLVTQVEKNDFWMIDCQQDTPHMRSLGAKTISSTDFYDVMIKNQREILKGQCSITAGLPVYSAPLPK